MKQFDFYVHRAKEAVRDGVIEHKSEDKKIFDRGRDIVNKKSKYNKLVAITSLLVELLPGNISIQLKKALDNRDFSALPFDLDKYKFMERNFSQGGITKVHLLQNKDKDKPSYVVKINYVDFDSLSILEELAKKQHEEYKEIKSDYIDLPSLIIDEMTFVTTNKKDKIPVIANIQEYLGDNLQDIFVDLNKEDLLKLIKKYPDLKEELNKFIDITLSLANKQDKVIDLIGYKNLSIVEQGDKAHLLFIDPHNICYFATEKNKKRIKKMKQALIYLEELKQIL